jgi:hypothetical protein
MVVYVLIGLVVLFGFELFSLGFSSLLYKSSCSLVHLGLACGRV